jgi:hypothetical protein
VAGTVRRWTLAWVAALALGGTFLTPGVAADAAAAVDLECFGAPATILGTPGDDVIRGTNGPDVIVSGRGDDRINGRGGDDLICGRSGDDQIRGGKGNDKVRGWRGADELAGGPGNDRLLGGPQADRLLGSAGDDQLDGGPASDECDGGSGSDTLVRCEVSPNTAPIGVDDAASTDEDSAKAIAVLANDTDPDGDALQVASVNTTTTHGQVTVTGGGSGVSYNPNGQFESLGAGASGSDTFTYTVSDGQGGTDTAMVTVTVTGVDDKPTAVDDTTTVLEDSGATTIDVLANDTDGDGGPKTVTGKTNGAHGTVAITNAGADLTYTPDANYCNDGSPTDDFTYTLNGGSTATVSVTVTCVDDPGTAVDDTKTVLEDSGATTVDVLANDTDVDGGSVTGVTQPANGTVAITHSGADVSYTPDADYCNDGSPTDDFTYTVPGGSTATVHVTVTCVDDDPVAVDDSTTVAEDSGATTIDVLANDTDDNLGSTTITGKTDGAHGSVAITNAGADLTYTPDANYCNDGSPTDDFTYTLNGGSTATVHVTVTCADDAPDVDLDTGTAGTGSTATFLETNPHAGTGVLVAPDAQVTDLDDTNIESATITLTNHPDGDSESLSATIPVGSGITGGTYDSGTGVLSFTGSASKADYATLIASIRYDNVANPPNSVNRIITVEVNDGDHDSNSASAVVTVIPLNAAPVVDLNGTGTAGIDVSPVFTESAGPATLAPVADVTDTDDADLASATVKLTNRPDGGAESLSVNVAGTSITADAYVPGTGVLFLHGVDTKAHYQQVLRTVAYANTSDAPDTANRGITFVVNDGTDDSGTATADTSVVATNDAPTLDLNGGGAGANETATYAEDQPAVTLAPNTLASDPDNANLQSATVTLTNHPDGAAESLSVDTSGTSITSGAYNSGTGVLSLSGSDTVAHYQQVLRTIVYLNSSQNAATANRVVTFVVNDGSASSNSPTVTVTIQVVNDAPSLTQPDGTLTYTEDTPSENHADAVAPNLTASDADNANLAFATVQITSNYQNGQDVLSFASNAQVSGAFNATTGTMTLTPTGASASVADFQAALRAVTYANTSDTPNTSTRTVSFQVDDGQPTGHASNTVTRTIDVVATNDAPVAGNEAFNAANSAVGNTSLSVNDTTNHGGPADGRMATPDPTDTAPVLDRPFKGITGDILTNDTDAESANSALTAVAGTFSTNDGGSVTIQADGDFVYEPAPGTSCTDHSDFFTYNVTDNDPGTPLTGAGTVTVATAGCVWYVNNDDAQGNSGTSDKPFDTLAQAQTASVTGDSIFVYDGNDSSAGYNAGVLLKANQQLIGEAATLGVGSDTLHLADSANRPTLTNNNADVVTLASGSTEQGLAIDPQGTGGGICGGTACGGPTNPVGGTLDDINITDTGTKGTQPGLELDGSSGTFTISNLVVNNGDGNNATSTDEGVRLNKAGTVNFVSAGTISITTNGAAGLDAAAGGGTTDLGSASSFDTITVTNSGNGGVTLAGTTGSGTTFGNLQLTTTQGTKAAFSVQTAGSFSVTGGNASATGGPAVDVVTTNNSSMSFSIVSSSNSASDGINIDGIGTGTFSASSGVIAGEQGIGFDLNGGSGGITYPGSFSDGTGPLVAEVTNRSGGVVTLSGSMDDSSDAGGGINEAGNTAGSTVYSGSLKRYNTGASAAITVANPDNSTHTATWSGGGTDIDTTSGNGVNVTGVGSTPDGSVQFSGSGNTIDATTLAAGNRALNIADVNLAATGVTFQRISASGGTNGIRLNDTGAAGAFSVTGTGSASSGGTITGSTGAGIDLAGVGNGAALDRMSVTNGGDDGVRANDVTKLTLYNSSVTSNGNAVNENGLDLTDLKGVSGIKNTTVSGSGDFNALLNNSASTALDLTVTGNTFSGAAIDDGLQVNGDANAVIRSNIDGNTFSNNHGDAIQIANVDGATDSSQQDVTINNNTITGSGSTSVDGGIVVQSADGEHLKASVTNNSITNVSVSALILNPGPNGTGSSTYDATASGNTIGANGVADSGSVDGDGIQVKSASDGDARIAVTNNIIRNYDKNGMMLRASESNQSGHSTQLTATGNQISQPDAANSETAILLEAGSSSADVLTACADVGGAGALANTFTGTLSPAIIGNFWLSLRFPNSHLQAPGYIPTGTLAGRQAYFLGRNTGFGVGVLLYVEDGTQDMASHAGGCTQPSAPTLPTPSP